MISEQLKKSILQAAIQGKLTQQLPEDGDARDLLKEIQKEKTRLIKEGKIKKEKPLPEITEDEIPFEIPENWCWVRLGEIGQIVGGGTPRTEDKLSWQNGKIPWLTPADMKNIEGKYVSHGERYITEYGLKHSSTQLMPEGAILFSSRAPIGYIAIANNDITTNQGFKSIVPHIFKMSEFIYYYLMTITPEIEKMGSGTTFKEVSGTVMKKVSIPLPPLNEQQRIVERIEELLPEIQSLKNDEAKLEELQKSFPKKMKDAILKYAIQGKLTQQLPEDGDARDLLKEIRKEKAQLIKEGKIKKEKPLPEITEDEIPFEIPENWCWCYFCDISIKVHYGFTAPSTPFGNSKLLRITDIQDDAVNWEKVPFCEINDRQLATYKLEKRDIVVARTGGTIGKTYLITEIQEVAVFASYLIRIVPSSHISERYLKYFMESDLYWKQLFNKAQGTGQANVNGQSIKKLMFPLPPLKEQKRIIKRIEELLPLCEKLK